MKMKRLMNAVLGIALATAPMLFGDEAPKAKETKSAAEAVKPAEKTVDPAVVDKMLAFIPEVAAEAANGIKVPGKDVISILRPQIVNALKAGNEIPQEEIQNFAGSMAQSMLMQILIVKEAEAKGIKQDPARAKEHVEKLKAQAGPENFKRMIADMNYTEEYLVEKFAEQFQVDSYIQSIAKCTEEEAKEFYDKNPKLFNYMEASHILAKFPGAPQKAPTKEEKEKAMAKIKEIQKQIAEGKDFAEVAKAMSDDEGSAQEGGDLHRFGEGAMVPEFEKACKQLKAGEISKPVETQFGYHIIKLKEAGTVKFDEIKGRIMEQLANEKQNKAFNETVARLMKQHNGKINIPPAQPKVQMPAQPKAQPKEK